MNLSRHKWNLISPIVKNGYRVWLLGNVSPKLNPLVSMSTDSKEQVLNKLPVSHNKNETSTIPSSGKTGNLKQTTHTMPVEYMTETLMKINDLYNTEQRPKKVKRYVEPVKVERKAFPPVRQDLEEMIKKSGAGTLLALANNQAATLDGIHHFMILQRLNRIYRYQVYIEKATFYVKDLLELSEFHTFCALLAKRSNMFGPSMVYDSVMILQKLGIDSTHPAMKVLLQLMKSHINDLSPDQVICFGHTLSLLSQTKQTEALLCGAKIWLKENLLYEHLKFLNKNELIILLNLLSHSIPMKMLNWILTHLHRNFGTLSYDEIRQLFEATNRRKYVHQDLYKLCIHRLSKCLDTFSVNQMESLLDSYLQADFEYLLLDDIFLISKIAERCVSENISSVWDILFLCKICSNSYMDKNIINKLCNAFVENDELFHKLKKSELMLLVECLKNIGALCGVTWKETLQDYLRAVVDQHFPSMTEGEKAQVLLAMLTVDMIDSELGHYYKLLIQNFCESVALTGGLFSDHDIDSDDIVTLSLAVGFHDVPLSKQLADCHVKTASTGLILNHILDELFEKDYHIQHGKHCTGGIDHLLEKTDIHKDQTRIAILEKNEKSFFLNSSLAKGVTAKQVELLQRQGFTVILINTDLWLTLPADEKGPYIRRKVKESAHKTPSYPYTDLRKETSRYKYMMK